MAKHNPFIQPVSDDLTQLEQAFCLSSLEHSLAPRHNQPETIEETQEALLPFMQNNPQQLEQIANLIADKVVQTLQTQQLFSHQVKLEELKVDNQLMAKHIYTLLQKRDLQEKQLTHLQHETATMRKMFWKLYIKL